MNAGGKLSEGTSPVLSNETVPRTRNYFDDDSEDVMAGILDDDDTDSSSVASANPFMKFMPTSLSPTKKSQNPQNPMLSFHEPRIEKGVDRLLLMVKYPNAGEEDIQEVLRRREMQQNAAKVVASRKGQLFRERRQHEDAEKWRRQQEQELEQKRNQRQLKLKVQELHRQQQQQQMHSALDSLVILKDSAALDKTDEETGRYHKNHKYPKGTFDHATNVSSPTSSILPQRSLELEGTDDEADFDNAVMWQAATDEKCVVDFESGARDIRFNSNSNSTQQQQYQKHYPKGSPKKQQDQKQTRKSFGSVLFGSASKIFGNVKPLAAADGNALVPSMSTDRLSSSVVTSESTGDALSVNACFGGDGDNRSVSNPTSQASVMTYKISNVRSTDRSEYECEFGNENRTGNANNSGTVHHIVHTVNNNSNSENHNPNDDKKNNGKGGHRKKHKLLILVVSLIVLLAVICTVLALIIGHRRRANNINASKSSEKQQQIDSSIDTSRFTPSPSPSSGTSTKVDPSETATKNPLTDTTAGASSPSEEDVDDDEGNEIVSSTASAFNSPSPVPTAVRIPTPAVVPFLSASPSSSTTLFSINSLTNFPTAQSISTLTLAEQNFSDWVWSEETEGGPLLQGAPSTDQRFGQSIALSEDGQVMVVGAPDASDNTGIVRIYEWRDGSWISGGSLFGRNEGDQFGYALALSADGRVLAVSEPTYNGSAGDKTGNIRTYIYSPFGYISMAQDIEGEDPTDQFGIDIALSSDGRRMAVGAPYGTSSQSKTNGGKSRLVSGTARVFEWSVEEKEWITIGNRSSGTPLIGTSDLDWFGRSIDLNEDGSLLCVGAPRNAEYGGYVQCFEEEERNEKKISDSTATQWKKVGGMIRNQDGITKHDDDFGASIRVSRDPTGTRHRVAIGAPGKNSRNALEVGHAVVYEFNPSAAERGWIRLGKKVLTSESSGDDFQMGFSLDFHEDLLVVGIPGANGGAGKVEFFEFQKDTWEWVRNPTAFDGSATASSSYGSTISMTPRGDFAVGSPQSNDNVGSISFYRRKI